MTEIEMVEVAEEFFISLGFSNLPDTLWERSLFVKPADRDVVYRQSGTLIVNQDQNQNVH